MSMEIDELKKGIATATEQMQKTHDDIEQLKEKVRGANVALNNLFNKHFTPNSSKRLRRVPVNHQRS